MSGDLPPYVDHAPISAWLNSIYKTSEANGRSMRAEVTKYDETMEDFRQHVYGLRRIILSGKIEQSNDILRRYFQVGCRMAFAMCISG